MLLADMMHTCKAGRQRCRMRPCSHSRRSCATHLPTDDADGGSHTQRKSLLVIATLRARGRRGSRNVRSQRRPAPRKPKPWPFGLASQSLVHELRSHLARSQQNARKRSPRTRRVWKHLPRRHPYGCYRTDRTQTLAGKMRQERSARCSDTKRSPKRRRRRERFAIHRLPNCRSRKLKRKIRVAGDEAPLDLEPSCADSRRRLALPLRTSNDARKPVS